MLQTIKLSRLRPHPGNANCMADDLLDKLIAHIERTGHYPPLIVRPLPDPGAEPVTYQLLDGHHRCLALQRLGHTTAQCLVWDVDDAQALVLLTTLNRLQGQDDPKRRAALVGQLTRHMGDNAARLAKLLPESAAQVRKYLALLNDPPKPAPPPAMKDLPAAVTFFLTGAQRDKLNAALVTLDEKRETALMMMVDRLTG